MTRALLYKEFRETLGIAAVGLVALLGVAASSIGFPLLPFGWLSRPSGWQIPFVSDSFVSLFALVAAGLAVALGFRQSIGDFLGDAQLFLLHRPISRGRIYATKLLLGLAIYLLCGVAPILLYAGWAATPGTHASPFAWSMTTASWVAWLTLTVVYLGAFLSGIRPAAWFGTRLAPLAAAAGVSFVVAFFTFPIVLLFVIVADALLITMILAMADSREFA
jgi:hypothetical protein